MRGHHAQVFKTEMVRQVKAGQAITAVAKVICILSAILVNWVRLIAKEQLDAVVGLAT